MRLCSLLALFPPCSGSQSILNRVTLENDVKGRAQIGAHSQYENEVVYANIQSPWLSDAVQHESNTELDKDDSHTVGDFKNEETLWMVSVLPCA